MKTKIEWEQDIIDITNSIDQEVPELCNSMTELMLTFSKNDQINNKNLEAYYNSLERILNKHVDNKHNKKASNKLEAPIFAEYSLYPSSEEI